MDRRSALRLLGGAAALPAAPAIVRAQAMSPDDVYAALRSARAKTLDVPGGQLRLVVQSGGADAAWLANVHDWVDRAVAAVGAYFGRFPVDRAGLLIRAVDGSGVRGGVSYGFGSSAVKVDVGRDSTLADMHDDWVLTHEFVHLGFPSLRRRHVWIEEGSATYVEPIARIQAGQMPAAQMWGDLLRDLPKGQPGEGDAGLDNTHTWARTYWGGALFCFVVDVELRRRTDNRHGLPTALRAIRDASGGNVAFWTLEQALAAGDRPTGLTVLADTWRQMGASPVEVDIAGLMAQLGVGRRADGAVVLDDGARLASVRRAITPAR